MSEVSGELMYELLKQLHRRMDSFDHKLDEVKGELTAIRMHQFAMQQDMHNIYGVLTRHDQRLDRIERRLELVEPAR